MAVLFVVVVVAVLAFWFLAIDRTTRKRLAVRETAPSTASFDDTESQTSFNISATPPHPYRPWRSGKFAMTMGIRKVDAKDWLGLDNKYHQEQQLRRELLEHHKSGVLQVLPGSEAACAEVLEMVIEHLTRWYPSLFYRPGGDRNYIRNGLTGRTYKVTAPYTIPPLEVAALLVMEDLNIMIKGFGPDAEEHYL